MRRWCPGCKGIHEHRVFKLGDREHAECQNCYKVSRRYDRRPRPWAGV